jgi:vacuolar-type H+-ATPase subunit F/Vma7
MQRLKQKLEELDEVLFALEDKVGLDSKNRTEASKKYNELLKQLRAREAGIMAVAQKVASRLDQTIEHVENIVRH